MPLRYEDYARQVSSPEMLEQELDAMHGGEERHLVAISKELDNTEIIAAHLGLRHREVKDVEVMYRYDPTKQR